MRPQISLDTDNLSTTFSMHNNGHPCFFKTIIYTLIMSTFYSYCDTHYNYFARHTRVIQVMARAADLTMDTIAPLLH